MKGFDILRLSAPTIIGSGAVAIASLLTLTSCSTQQDFASLRGDGEYNVLLITVDTIRADRLGAYGFEGIDTPSIDSLAARGVTFTRAYSPTPLTLPSHTSLFSGTFPPYHGVRDNGGFTVPDELTLLAESFAAQGYDTAAFIAAFVLDSRWGLDQGFDTYIDDFDVRGQRFISMGAVQRPAEEVIDAALEWLEGEGGSPFFLWVHLYDPHTPYAPPEPYRSEYAGKPYLGEIAYTDAQIGRLLEGLSGRGVSDDTFVVLAGDHGESLGEHGEVQHGFFIYEAATHVPLIVATPFEQFHGIERSQLVSLVDVMPTILEMSGAKIPAVVQGQSLVPLFSGQPDDWRQYVYSETFYPRYHFGWSELQAIQDEQYKLILSPEPELYDLTEDPSETTNLVDRERELFEQLEAVAGEFVGEISQNGDGAEFMAVDEETMARLASLGYLGSFSITADDPVEKLASPRGKIGIYNKSIRARWLMQTERYDEAELLLQEIVSEDPGVFKTYQTLGQLYTLQERFADAVDIYQQAIPLRPEDAYAYINLADAQLKLGLVEEAEKTALDSFDFIGPNAHILYLLGNIRSTQSRYPDAIPYYEQCLALNPESAVAYSGLARAHFELEDLPAAEDNARKALAINDFLPSMHFTLARIHAERGEPQQAVAEYLREIEIFPNHVPTHFNLAMMYRVIGQSVEEERHLTHVLEIDPQNPRALLFMARSYMNRGENLVRAVEMAMAAVAEPREPDDLMAGYFLLAELHDRLGDAVKAREYALKAQRLIQR